MCVSYCCICPNSDHFDVAGGWQLTSITPGLEWVIARHRQLDSLSARITDAQSSLAAMSELPFEQWHTPDLLNSALQLQESTVAIGSEVISFRNSHLMELYNAGAADPLYVLERTVELATDVFDRAARLVFAVAYYGYSLQHFVNRAERGTLVAVEMAEDAIWDAFTDIVRILMPLVEELTPLERAPVGRYPYLNELREHLFSVGQPQFVFHNPALFSVSINPYLPVAADQQAPAVQYLDDGVDAAAAQLQGVGLGDAGSDADSLPELEASTANGWHTEHEEPGHDGW